MSCVCVLHTWVVIWWRTFCCFALFSTICCTMDLKHTLNSQKIYMKFSQFNCQEMCKCYELIWFIEWTNYFQLISLCSAFIDFLARCVQVSICGLQWWVALKSVIYCKDLLLTFQWWDQVSYLWINQRRQRGPVSKCAWDALKILVVLGHSKCCGCSGCLHRAN